MAVPDYQSLMLPLLEFTNNKKSETSVGEAIEILADKLQLSENDLKEMLPSGIQSAFVNRIGWAATYMKKAGLLEATRRGYFKISQRGKEVLLSKPKVINVKFLKQFPEFIEFQRLKGTRGGANTSYPSTVSGESLAETPSEALESAYENLRYELAGELLAKLKRSSPTFFERIVVELLVKWVTAGQGLMPEKQSGKAATAALTE